MAGWLDSASSLGIMAVDVALLVIGGHVDLSAGVMTATTALTVGIVDGTPALWGEILERPSRSFPKLTTTGVTGVGTGVACVPA